MIDREDRVLWLSNVRRLPFRERIEAAARGSFGWLSTSPHDFEQSVASGLSAAEMRRVAEDYDVRLTFLDPLARWVPDWEPRDVSADTHKYFSYSQDDFFRIAEALSVDKIHVIGAFSRGRYEVEYLAERYAEICDRAARNGLLCTLEAIPFLGIETLAEAWRIVSLAARPNSGLVFDNWHFERAGRDDALLKQISPGVIKTVQLADGTRRTPPGRSDIDDCNFFRRPIGEGELPVAEVVHLLREAGHLTSVGPEIFSAELDTMSGAQIIDRITPGFNAVLESTASL